MTVLPARAILIVIAVTITVASSTHAYEQVESKVAMRDGTELATSIFLPDGDGPWPCVLTRTPYGRRGMFLYVGPYTTQGFALITQDCRGKGSSEGDYRPFMTDHHDGYDTVEWVAKQSWSNGRVGMFGGSALGLTTNLAATQVPPHLECAYVVVTPASARRNSVYTGGVYRKEMNDGWLEGQGAPEITDLQIKHPPGDAFWNWREIRSFHSKIRIPIYNVAGWYDVFSQGAIDNFTGLQKNGAGLAAGNQRLAIGPWAHGALDGRLKYPDANAAAYLTAPEQIRWFRRWLKDDEKAINGDEAVRYYVMGDTANPDSAGNRWVTTKAWPPPSRPQSYYLHPRRRLRTSPMARADSLTYIYDPTMTVQTVGGANLIQGGKGPDDQRKIPERQDYLRFSTEPLERAIEVAGQIYVDLYIESDAPDTDFCAKLVDIHPDGYEALVTDGILRARYREGLEREVPLEKGVIVRLRVDLWSTAIAFDVGHRIALHVSSSNDPKFDPNPNTGEPLRSSTNRRRAKNTIHLSPEHPSRLLLPVVREHPATTTDS